MVCEYMLLPHRDDNELNSPLKLYALPNGQWKGKIAYLDRDGVLNKGSEKYINSIDELVILPGVPNSIAALREAGFRICVVTNQSPIGRGLIGKNKNDLVEIKTPAGVKNFEIKDVKYV